MPTPRRSLDDQALRRALTRTLRPFVDGTAAGISSSVMTQSRVAATARDAAVAVLPLLGAPAPSAHRVRASILPALVCSWTELDTVFEETLDRLITLPSAIAGVPDPAWDAGLPPAPRSAARAAARASSDDDVQRTWSTAAREGDIVTGPAGTTGTLIRADRRHALIVEDARSVRTHGKCACDPLSRRERGEVAFELITFGRRRAVLDVRAGHACALCRAPVVADDR
ncbi:MAG: hypothetical protein JF589_02610 [Gemmatimonadetes bacterium]|nr:hypothetical protein [Gemmatimonadota bacterium]